MALYSLRFGRQSSKPIWLAVSAVILLIMSLVVSVLFGASNLSLAEVNDLIQGQGTKHVEWVVWDLRLPRVLTAALVGVHFALAGFVLQTLTRNPLADAGILGISAGASLSAVLVILVLAYLSSGVGTFTQGQVLLSYLPLIAMLGGIGIAFLVYYLSGASRLTSIRLILSGVVLSTLLSALVTGLLALWGHSQTEMIVEWLAGTLHGRSWAHLSSLWPWTLLGLCSCCMLIRPLNLLRLEDDQVLSVGLNLALWRFVALTTAAILAASAVGVVGPIGFMGLVVPHICRRLAPHHFVWQFAFCVLIGALLMMIADFVGRIAILPYELPVGVVCALIGVPFFLYLLRRQA